MIQVSDLKEEISRLEQLQETKVLDEKLVLADKQCQLMEKKALDSQHKAEVADQRGQWVIEFQVTGMLSIFICLMLNIYQQYHESSQ